MKFTQGVCAFLGVFGLVVAISVVFGKFPNSAAPDVAFFRGFVGVMGAACFGVGFAGLVLKA